MFNRKGNPNVAYVAYITVDSALDDAWNEVAADWSAHIQNYLMLRGYSTHADTYNFEEITHYIQILNPGDTPLSEHEVKGAIYAASSDYVENLRREHAKSGPDLA